MPNAKVPTVFDIASQQIAGVYAKAFLGAAESANQVETLVAELGSLIDEVLDENPQLEALFGSGFVKHEEMVGILDRTLGSQASPQLMSFLKVVSAHGRLGDLRAIRGTVDDLFNESRGRVDVTLTTSAPIDDGLQSEIVGRLRSMLGAEPMVTVLTDSSLLGGLVVRVGDTVYDGSLKTRLAHLRTQMVASTVQQIETSRQRFM